MPSFNRSCHQSPSLCTAMPLWGFASTWHLGLTYNQQQGAVCCSVTFQGHFQRSLCLLLLECWFWRMNRPLKKSCLPKMAIL